jgi:hypothetical protein
MVGPTFRTTIPNGGTLPTGAYKRDLRFRRDSQMKIYNSIFMDFVEGLHIDGVACENAALVLCKSVQVKPTYKQEEAVV